jgi:hypothetical protein
MFGRAGAEGTSIAWLRKVMDIPSGPGRIALPATHKPEVAGEFDLDAGRCSRPAGGTATTTPGRRCS